MFESRNVTKFSTEIGTSHFQLISSFGKGSLRASIAELIAAKKMRSTALTLVLLLLPGCDALQSPNGNVANSQRTQTTDFQDQQNLTSSPIISMELKTQLNDRGEEFGGSFRHWESKHLVNTGTESIHLEWVLVNNRDDCFAVPVMNAQGNGAYLTVVDDDEAYNVVNYVDLKVGQSIQLDTAGTSCGEIIRLKVGTSSGEYDLEIAR